MADLIRYVYFAAFGLGVTVMLATNFLAFYVLRPPKHMGFLWWHVVAISVSFLCLGSVALERVFSRLGSPLTWQTGVVGVGVLSFTAAQFIIFNVERQRYAHKRALELGLAKPVTTMEPLETTLDSEK